MADKSVPFAIQGDGIPVLNSPDGVGGALLTLIFLWRRLPPVTATFDVQRHGPRGTAKVRARALPLRALVRLRRG